VTSLAARLAVAGTIDRDLWLGRAMLATAWIVALVVGSNLFQVSSWIVGDIAYHRGVAYTMQGGALQGEGPYPGLISYYGGLYPLVLGWVAAVTALPFDTVLSVASWGFALVWPASLLVLARRIWPADPLAHGAFVLLGTTAAPFTNRALIWVDSVLASAQNAFPVYPRDVAMVLMVLLAAAVLDDRRAVRIVGGGLALAAIVLVHLQIAILAGWLLLVWTAWRARREGAVQPARELGGSLVLAAVVTAWWWLPRLAALVATRGVLLGGFPGAPELRLGPANFLMAFGIVGVLAVLGLAVLASRRPLPGHLPPFLLWIAAFAPLVLVDRIVPGGFDLLSERRVWLIASIPLTVLAASVAVALLRQMSGAWAATAVLVLLLVPSVPGTYATLRLVADAWEPGRAGGRVFDAARWDPLVAELNRRVRDEHGYVVASYDAYEAWIWSFSGAQVPSLWLPGPFKLGFEPAILTGTGQVVRWRDQTAAYQAGIGAICAHARRYGADAIVLDAESGLVGVRDVSPAAPYRVDPRSRSEKTISRSIAPGTTYEDRGGLDVLVLDAGTSWVAGWTDSGARLLALEISMPSRATVEQLNGPAVRVAVGDEAVGLGRNLGPGPHRLTMPLDGLRGELRIEAVRPLDLVRVTAFSPLPGIAPPDGPALMTTDAWCRTS
jgi:hypothetical protein